MKMAGFSLVELSIVLVILGLLTGGILGGQNLMHAAELRSIGKEYEQYTIAVNTFQDKYFALPGDMNNAHLFWGPAGGTTGADAACYGSATGTGTETCNGDGDGIVGMYNAAEYSENFMFWQHLANAQLIEGQFTGIAGATNNDNAVLGENVPRSKLGNAGWTVRGVLLVADTENFDANYQNALVFGEDDGANDMLAAVLTPEDAWNIDTKSDDGQPGRGKIIARFWDTCTDATGNTDNDANYLLSDGSEQCALIYRDAF